MYKTKRLATGVYKVIGTNAVVSHVTINPYGDEKPRKVWQVSIDGEPIIKDFSLKRHASEWIYLGDKLLDDAGFEED